MVSTTEPTINTYVAQALRKMHPRWAANGAIVSQATGTVRGSRGAQPDILVRVPGAAPLVIEAEIIPARTLDEEALGRIGKELELSRTQDPVETVVALRYPERLSDVAEASLAAELASATDLEWCVWTEGPGEVRFPSQGWIKGGLADLAGTLETVAVSQRRIDRAADVLQRAVENAAWLLADLELSVRQRVADCLHQEPAEQTMKMAASIVANAFLFQIAVAANHGTPSVEETRVDFGDPRHLHKQDVLEVWRQILEVNYWPIFHISRRILLPIDEANAQHLCNKLGSAAGRLAEAGAVEVQDLAGQMFGRLIADRKFLATFYTLPESSAMLAEMAVARLDGRVDWGNRKAVIGLRVADLACGTGALLSAVYRRIASRVRRAGKNDKRLHAAMIQDALIGADIMPAAAHLTTMMLSASHPSVGFGKCGVHVLPYGRTSDGTVAVGSLDLLSDSGTRSLLGRPGTRLAGRASEVETGADVAMCEVDDNSLDICIMNPPFTRPTNHKTAAAAGVPVPSFAGFGTSDKDQREMSDRLKELSEALGADRAGRGNVGLASNFVDLAHAKLRPGGVLALILPFAFVNGGAWEPTRRLLRKHYTDVTVVSIAAYGSKERAFSADTGMAEVALVAVKRTETTIASARSPVGWPSLVRRPRSVTEAVETARAVAACAGSTESRAIEIGHERIGLFPWGDIATGGLAGLAEPQVGRAALALNKGRLRFARVEDMPIAVARLGEVGKPGPVDRDINGVDKKTGAYRGPFDLKRLEPGGAPSYPILWCHDAPSGRESQIEVLPDHEGWIRDETDRRRELSVWATATRLHLNRDFRLNSQSLAACMTPDLCIGGTAWPSFILVDKAWEKVVALWLNSTLGLQGFWWTGTRQQQGRARLTVTRLKHLISIDPREMTERQLSAADDVFDRLKRRRLLPANEAYRDDARHELDEAVLCEVLGLPTEVLLSLASLRHLWCREPSVHGGKSTRPG